MVRDLRGHPLLAHLFGPLPLLVAAVLARLASIGRAGRGAAFSLAGALIVFNVVTHVAFVQAGAGTSVRPVDTAIAKLDALGVTACYADSRIAQVISFESTERVVCADFNGLRNYAALRTVDRVEAPETVAIVTHRVMRNPEPASWPRARAYRRDLGADRRGRLRDLPPLRPTRSAHAPGSHERLARAGVVRPGGRGASLRPPDVDALDGPDASG